MGNRGLPRAGQTGGDREAVYMVGLPQDPSGARPSGCRSGLGLLPPPSPWPCCLGAPRALTCPHLSSLRDIAKNALLHWRVFIYWTLLGLFDALVFFFGAYFMFENTTVTGNGQVRGGLGRGDGAAGSGVKLGTAQAWHGRRGRPLGVCRRWSGPSGGARRLQGQPSRGRRVQPS